MLAANELAIAGKVGCGLEDGDDQMVVVVMVVVVVVVVMAICVPSRLGLSFLYLEAVPPFLLETKIAPARKLSQKEIGLTTIQF